MQVLDTMWFSGIIGLVKAKDLITGETKFYMGLGQGEDEDKDIANILANGTKFETKNLLAFLQTKDETDLSTD